MSGARGLAPLLAALAVAACDGGASSSGEPAVPCPWSAPPTLALDLRADVAPREVALLQPVHVTLDLFWRGDAAPGLAPQVDDKVFAVDAQQRGPVVPLGDGSWQRTTLVLLPIDGPGELEVPEFRAEASAPDGAPLVATTPAVPITVTSLLDGAGASIEAPGDPFPPSWRGWWWLGGGAALLLLGAGGWWLLRGRAPRHAHHPDAVAQPPHTRALRELQRLRGAPRTTPAEIEAFYVAVSQVLRVYLEQRFALRAPERTTEEFLRDLEAGDGLAQRHRAELERFLSQCDLVKFAAVRPGAAEHDAVWQLAADFVEATRVDRPVEAVA
ncbi:MAG: hypothetical protein H6835_01220 [Planctomycetes bacterium]|nr:hypothetical protein [Planctomycetota bacterium]